LNMVFALVSGISVVAAGALLIPDLGVNGAAWARLACFPLSLVSRTIVHYWVLEDRRWYGVFATFGPILVTFVLGWAMLRVFPFATMRLDLLIVALLGVAAAGAAISGPLACRLILPLHRPRIERA
jgi:hypothetical protein